MVCHPNSEASYRRVRAEVLTPGRAASVDQREPGFGGRRRDEVELVRTSRVVVGEEEPHLDRRLDSGVLQQRDGTFDVDVGVLGRAVLRRDRLVGRRPGNGCERVTQPCVGVQWDDQAIDDALAWDRLEERLTDGERRRLVTPVGRGIEGAAVGDHQVDVLVGAGFTGDRLDAAVGETFDLGQQIGGRLRLDDVDFLVLQRLHRGGRDHR